MSYTELDEEMKSYEDRRRLDPFLPAVIRLDGRGFHKLNLEKPFDNKFIESMTSVTKELMKEVQGTILAYQQSDEISLILKIDPDKNQELYFGGRIQKIVSSTAAFASVSLSNKLGYNVMFDSRAFNLPSINDVIRYLIWRIKDWKRNAINMVTYKYYSHKDVIGKSSKERLELLRKEHGINFEIDYPPYIRYGNLLAITMDDIVQVALQSDSYDDIKDIVYNTIEMNFE